MQTNEAVKVPLTLGVKKVNQEEKQGIHVAFEVRPEAIHESECGILLYDRESGELLKRHVIDQDHAMGHVKYDFIEDMDYSDIAYLFFAGDQVWTDTKAGAYIVQGRYGHKKDASDYKAIPVEHVYDWENVEKPRLSYSESIMYCLHVRGFTRHESAGVACNGTFRGIVEKLDYLQELGITTIELQPCYEFDEAEVWRDCDRLNYWGYKQGYYYAPKSLYAFTEDSVGEFKDLVKACHQRKMEVILQFYFPDTVNRGEISGILRYWSCYYQVDGFHIMGNQLPLREIIEDPYLSDIKIMHHYLPLERTSIKSDQKNRLALYGEDYLYTMRRFLKSDAGMLADAILKMRRNPDQTGVINYFSNYFGFTMMDMVSYNRKHNEANGEDNRDGADYNFSWNCGEEGASKKRNVVKLRKKQLHNALVMLMLSQGTPLLFMGDEFGNSQLGNNNPYNQDNDITWLNWRDKSSNKDLYNFVKSLIAFRKRNKVFHQDKECTMADYRSVGYPDLSYHDQVAWMPQILPESRSIAFMLCGDYTEENAGELWYVAINMHWEPQEFGLPRIPADCEWEKCLTTESTEDLMTYESAGAKSVIVAPRSIAVYYVRK